MATAAKNNDGTSSEEGDSLTQESDEMQEMYCEHCEKEIGTIVRAEGFCKTCLDYLCSTCLRYHRKYQDDHTIEDSDTMPQDFCFKKCHDHSTELLKFYCKSCQQKACIVCKANNHSECISMIEHLPSLVGSTDLIGEVSTMVKTIDTNLAIINDTRDEISSKRSEVKALSQNAISSIKNHKKKLEKSIDEQHKNGISELNMKHGKEMEKYEERRAYEIAKLDKEKEDIITKQQNDSKMRHENLDRQKINSTEQMKKREKELEIKCLNTKQGDETTLDKLSPKADKITADLTTMKQNICKKMQANQTCEAFLALKEAENQLEKINADMEEVSQSVPINNYEFQSSDEKISELNSTIRYGSLEDKSKIKRNISFLCNINTNYNKDQVSSITGLCKIFDTYLIVADNNNESIKMIDIVKRLVSEVIKLEDKPFGITLVENNTVAVTIPKAKKIQLISATQDNQLSLHSHISVEDKCYGIALKKPNLIVGCPGKVLVLSLDGTIINTFAEFVGTPSHITLYPNGNLLYVSGKTLGKSLIFKITMAGKVMAKEDFTNSYLLSHRILAIDKAGTIYQYAEDRRSVIQLSADLKRKQINVVGGKNFSKLSITEPNTEEAMCLFYCNKENKLYIGTDNWFIQVYEVT